MSISKSSPPRARRRPRPVVILAAVVAGRLYACRDREPTPPPARSRAPSCALRDFTIARFPFDGASGRDWLLNNTVDLDPSSPGLADFRGRTGTRARTYDGHQGLDIDIPSFREMDSGRAMIHAVTDGVVEQVIDDQPDRNVTCAGHWNVVRVRHPNGFNVFYGHIRRGSARVRPGQRVAPGTPLAIAGSAGCSTQPHLHLEVRDCDGRAVETLAAPGVWINPPNDDAPSAVMDVMLVDGDVPTVAQVKDPAPNPTVVEPDGTLGVGLSLAGRGGDLITATLIEPGGRARTQYLLLDDHGARRFGHWYPRFALAIGAAEGPWTVEVRINGARAAARTVTVSLAAPAPPR
jgi:murein DD-endopeptidase MepM/ murein hydrolase activator NlpD